MDDPLVPRYRWSYPDPDEGYLAQCLDRKTGRIVCQYDLGDPADWSQEYGGQSEGEMLWCRGLDPMEVMPLSEVIGPF